MPKARVRILVNSKCEVGRQIERGRGEVASEDIRETDTL